MSSIRRGAAVFVAALAPLACTGGQGAKSTTPTHGPPDATTSSSGTDPATDPDGPGATGLEDPETGERTTVVEFFSRPDEPSGIDTLREADGTLSTDTLLSWWSASMEPVEGVAPLDADLVADADPAELVALLAPRVDELPDDVVRAIKRFTQPSDARPVGLRRRAPAQADLTDAEADRLVTTSKAELEAWLGEPLGIGVRVSVHSNPDVFSRPMTGAMAVADFLGGSLVGPCVMHIRQSGGPVEGIEAWRHSAVLHELYHCYQYRLVRDAGLIAAQPPWIAEGTASWVGERLSGGSRYSEGWMRLWLGQSRGLLGNRSYDAIGLMWLLDQEGVAMKGRFDAMLTKRGDFEARLLATLGPDAPTADRIRSRWGSHIFNRRWGARWQPTATAHAPSDARPEATAFTYVAGGSGALLRSRGTSASTFSGEPSGDLLRVVVSSGTWGALRAQDGTEFELKPGAHNFCISATACTPCPSGDYPLGGPPTRLGEGTLNVGIMTETDGSVMLTGSRWSSECDEEPTDSEPPEPTGDAANKCTERVPLAEFRRITGETYANAYESSRDQCIFENARYETIMDLDATPLDIDAAKAAASQKDIFITAMEPASAKYRELRNSGFLFAAISPDGVHLAGIGYGKQVFAETRSRRITTQEMVALIRFYARSF